MLITVSTTHAPATDLGYLLHKHPGRAQAFEMPVGTAHVFYPEATDERCTAALLVEVDPVALVRGRTVDGVGHYVNDRPYATSSLLAVALRGVFATALAGRCTARPELAATPIPLQIEAPALACGGGPQRAALVFAPLGWTVDATALPLDEAFPEWGDAPYVRLRLRGTLRLSEALSHLYVLLPALDGTKHYWIGPDEVEKLLRAGGAWLAGHPEREWITRRYLKRAEPLVHAALARLAEADDTAPAALDPDPGAIDGPAREPLHAHRRGAILAVLRAAGARRVADLGCGEGRLVADLLDDPAFTEVVATDVSARALELAARRLRLDRMAPPRRERLRMFQSSLVYTDERIRGLDAAVLSEVVEHVDPPRLAALERAVFAVAAPATVVVTTPNTEHNVRYGLGPGALRHPDHRFEWTRAEFRAWAGGIGARTGYAVRFLPVGPEDAEVGAPTQMAVFSRAVPA